MSARTIKRTISDILDDLACQKRSLSRRSEILDSLEQLIARICTPAANNEFDEFLQLQDSFECNVASRLMYNITALFPLLQHAVNLQNDNNDSDGEALSISRLITQSLQIVQGLALIHYASKQFMGRRWCIELFVDLLTISRQLSTLPITNISEADSTSRSNPASSLASAAIDTLLCILVDSPSTLRIFEQADGIEVVVKTLKRAGVARDIRIKCLEFLYFYLIDETESVPCLKLLPNPSRTPSPERSASSGFSTPPVPRTPHKQASRLVLLRKELDFVPVTPKKAQVSRLGIGTPRSGSGAPNPYECDRGRENTPIARTSPTKASRMGEKLGVANGNTGEIERRRSTQEKKEILGSLLGNVDTLVEGVAKSGIWGLG